MNLAVNPATKDDVKRYLQNPSQVLTIVGQAGSGKLVVAKEIAAHLLDITEEQLNNHAYYFHIMREPGQRDISIDVIRNLILEMRSKVPGERTIKRVVIIEQADSLSRESQNALLKTLEQPNPDTVFIMTLDSLGNILPTVLSRSQKLLVRPVSLSDSIKHYPTSDAKEVETAWNISEGSAALINQLLNSEDNRPEKTSIELAKKYLASNKYNRLLSIEELSRDKEATAAFLDGLSRTLKALHHSYVKKEAPKTSLNRLLKARKLVSRAQLALAAGVPAKLTLLNLTTSIDV